jgi:tetratricopeptide (TPR) repeat protein
VTPPPAPAPELTPADSPEARSAQASTLLYEAGVHKSRGELPEAVAAFTSALELDPESFSAYNNRGLIYLELNEFDRAIDDFTAAMKIQPNRAFVFTNRARAHQENGDLQRAIDDYTTAIDLDPEQSSYHLWRGNAYFQADKLQEAIDDYERALKLNRRLKEAKDRRDEARQRLKGGGP